MTSQTRPPSTEHALASLSLSVIHGSAISSRQTPSLTFSTVGSAGLTALFSESARTYDDLIGSANPNLSRLRKADGKLLVWHGEADPLIFPQGTRQYRHRVEKVMGDSLKVDGFFRLFLAPGVDHCGQGTRCVNNVVGGKRNCSGRIICGNGSQRDSPFYP
jgi:Tannase and feruloyl esterase